MAARLLRRKSVYGWPRCDFTQEVLVATTLENLSPREISPNPENPRMIFPDRELEKLAASVDESGGVLVPVYVYPDPAGEGYKLIDGERRWRVALRLGLDTIPAIVRSDPPDPADNLVEMF